jgi:hypothetical protein
MWMIDFGCFGFLCLERGLERVHLEMTMMMVMQSDAMTNWR